MLTEAMSRAKSTAPLPVARALEGMRFATPLGEVEMRAVDHQLIQPLYISTVARALADGKSPKKKGKDPEVPHDLEDTGFGFKTDVRIEGYVSAQPTSCQMKRPPKPAT